MPLLLGQCSTGMLLLQLCTRGPPGYLGQPRVQPVFAEDGGPDHARELTRHGDTRLDWPHAGDASPARGLSFISFSGSARRRRRGRRCQSAPRKPNLFDSFR